MAGRGAFRFAGRLMVNDPWICIRAAVDGLGIAYTLEALAEPFLRSGQLVRVLEDWSPCFEGMFLYYPGHRQVPAALRALIDMIRVSSSVPASRRPPEKIRSLSLAKRPSALSSDRSSMAAGVGAARHAPRPSWPPRKDRRPGGRSSGRRRDAEPGQSAEHLEVRLGRGQAGAVDRHQVLRAGGQRDDAVELGAQHHVVAWPADRRSPLDAHAVDHRACSSRGSTGSGIRAAIRPSSAMPANRLSRQLSW